MRQLEKFLSAAAIKIYRGFIVEKDINPSDIIPAKVNNILFIIRHQMGDMLCAMPALRSLKKAFPHSKIYVVTKESTRFGEVFSGALSPADEVYFYEYGFENFINLAKQLQDKNIDLAVVPSTVVFSGTNHFIAYFSKARYIAGVRSIDYDKNPAWYLLGIKNGFEWGLKKIHQVDRNLDIIRQLNIEPQSVKIRTDLSSGNREFAEDFFSVNFPGAGKKVTGFHPGAGKQSNVWPAEKFAELAYTLHKEFNAYIFISEGPADEIYVKRVKDVLAEKYGFNEAVVHKGGLMNNAAIIDKLDLFVTNDTGIMHIASGLSAPVIALFGETKAYEWGPLGDNKISVQSSIGNISSISVDEVYNACCNFLGKTVV